MPGVDPFVSLCEWRFSLYRGNDVVIDTLLDKIDATLPAGWVRESTYEQTRPRTDRIRCYLFDRPSQASLRLWLQRVTEPGSVGGPVQLLRPSPTGGTGQIGQLVLLPPIPAWWLPPKWSAPTTLAAGVRPESHYQV